MPAVPQLKYKPRGAYPFIQCRPEPAVFAAIDKAAATEEISRAELLRRAVDLYLATNGHPARIEVDPNQGRLEVA